LKIPAFHWLSNGNHHPLGQKQRLVLWPGILTAKINR